MIYKEKKWKNGKRSHLKHIITILYDPDDPSVANVKTGLFFFPIITGTIVIVFLILDLVLKAVS